MPSGILKGVHDMHGLAENKAGDADKKGLETSRGNLRRSKVFGRNNNRRNVFEEKFAGRAVNFNLKKKLATVFKKP